MDKLEKLMAKKRPGKEMSDVEKEAKMGVVGDLRKMASEAMGDKLRGLKKVSVAAPDQEGLEMGLEKAKEIVGEGMEESPEDEQSPEGISDTPDMSDMENLSEDELDQKLQHLMSLKQQMQDKKVRI